MVRLPDGTVGTGLKKFGAVIGDQAEIAAMPCSIPARSSVRAPS